MCWKISMKLLSPEKSLLCYTICVLLKICSAKHLHQFKCCDLCILI
uniref:Uncharacterized protein n=1 Tax=Macaca fascicularis TaxID=9541 RepID=A0A7N9CN65_MACFA